MRRTSLLSLYFLLNFALPLIAQSSDCPVPVSLYAHPEPTMFSEEQERVLGELTDVQHRRDFRIVEGPPREYLRRLGARLLQQVPPTKLSYTFDIIESGDVNAFTLPGGHIYVTRKLITALNSEDELAGVLAHEIGHNLLHHPSATSSRLFEVVLGATQVGDRADIESKFHQVEETIRLKSSKLEKIFKEHEGEQQDSDLLGIYIAAKAGYRPQALAEWWNRIFEVRGKTGNAFSDFFRATPPDQKRLRGMLQTSKQLPAPCLQIAHADVSGFASWQKSVLEADLASHPDTIAVASNTLSLQNPIHSDLETLRYSPDGKLLLAQDEFGINVFSRDPLKPLFQIPAEQAYPALFSPDSQSIVFSTEQMRVERWNVQRRSREFAREVWGGGCIKSLVSANAEYLACFRPNLKFRVVSTRDGSTFFEDKDRPDFRLSDFFAAVLLGVSGISHASFSSDSRYLLYRIGSTHTCVDLSSAKKIDCPGDVNEIANYSFDFQGSDRLFGVNRYDPSKSAVVSFPAGKKLFSMKLLRQQIAAPTHGDWAMVRPIKDYSLGIYSLKEKTFVMGLKRPAFDAFDDEFLNERRTGQIGRYRFNLPKPELIQASDIPASEITRTQVFAVSPDQRYLAFSIRSRGGVWDLQSGERKLFVRGFDSGYFIGSEFFATLTLDADEARAASASASSPAAKDEKSEKSDGDQDRSTIRYLVRFDVPGNKVVESRELEDKRSVLIGSHLILYKKPNDKKSDSTEFEVYKLGTDAVLWSRKLSSDHRLHFNARENVLVIQWPLDSDEAQKVIKGDAKLEQAARSMKEKEGDSLLELLDLDTGNRFTSLLIETGKGSFQVHDVVPTRDYVALGVNNNRTLIYSVATGQVHGRVFGDSPAIYSNQNLLRVRTDRNTMALYDLSSMTLKAEYKLPRQLIGATLANDGKQVIVLTSDQSVATLHLESPQVSGNVH